jgi:hypothetical protein
VKDDCVRNEDREVNPYDLVSLRHPFGVAIGGDNHAGANLFSPCKRGLLGTHASYPLKKLRRLTRETNYDRLALRVAKTGIVLKNSDSLWASRRITGNHKSGVEES